MWTLLILSLGGFLNYSLILHLFLRNFNSVIKISLPLVQKFPKVLLSIGRMCRVFKKVFVVRGRGGYHFALISQLASHCYHKNSITLETALRLKSYLCISTELLVVVVQRRGELSSWHLNCFRIRYPELVNYCSWEMTGSQTTPPEFHVQLKGVYNLQRVLCEGEPRILEGKSASYTYTGGYIIWYIGANVLVGRYVLLQFAFVGAGCLYISLFALFHWQMFVLI